MLFLGWDHTDPRHDLLVGLVEALTPLPPHLIPRPYPERLSPKKFLTLY